jgi:hypothetical protein
MKYLLTSFSVLALSACCTPEIIKEPIEVKVPVSVPCKIAKVDKPVMPFDGLKKEDSLFDKGKAALAELELRIAYEKQLEAAIKECQ